MKEILRLFIKPKKIAVNKINYPERQFDPLEFNKWCKELNVSILYKK